MKHYTIEQAEVLNLLPLERNKNDIDKLKQLAAEVNNFYRADITLQYSEQEGRPIYYAGFVTLYYKGLSYRINHDSYRKKYNIYCTSFTDDLKNINHNTITTAQQKFKEPQQIGVLNLKKITDWMEFYYCAYQVLKAENEKNKEMKVKFLGSIKNLPVVYNKDEKSGRITTNGITFKFEIYETYISTRVELESRNENDLSTFLKLSDNGYGKCK